MIDASVRKSNLLFSVDPGLRVLMATITWRVWRRRYNVDEKVVKIRDVGGGRWRRGRRRRTGRRKDEPHVGNV